MESEEGKIVGMRYVNGIIQVQYVNNSPSGNPNRAWWFDLDRFSRLDLVHIYQQMIRHEGNNLAVSNRELETVNAIAHEVADTLYYIADLPSPGTVFKRYRINIITRHGVKQVYIIFGPKIYKDRQEIDITSNLRVIIYVNQQILVVLRAV